MSITSCSFTCPTDHTVRAIKTKLNHLERAANIRGPGSSHRVELCQRHCSEIILHHHPGLHDIQPEDCRDEDEYRDIRRLLAQAANDGDEAHHWRPLGPPLTTDEIFREIEAKRQARINDEPYRFERIEANIKRRRKAEERP